MDGDIHPRHKSRGSAAKPSTSDTPRKHLLQAARLLTHTEQQRQQPGRATAVELLHMYLCRLFPARTLGVKADALNPLEACDSVLHWQGQMKYSKYSVARLEGNKRRCPGHPPRSSPNLELVAVTLGAKQSHGSPQHPLAGTAQLPPHRPSRTHSSQRGQHVRGHSHKDKVRR